MLWDDIGPASQGKILTAIIKGDDETAAKLLHGWSYADLRHLGRAGETLLLLVGREIASRPEQQQ